MVLGRRKGESQVAKAICISCQTHLQTKVAWWEGNSASVSCLRMATAWATPTARNDPIGKLRPRDGQAPPRPQAKLTLHRLVPGHGTPFPAPFLPISAKASVPRELSPDLPEGNPLAAMFSTYHRPPRSLFLLVGMSSGRTRTISPGPDPVPGAGWALDKYLGRKEGGEEGSNL